MTAEWKRTADGLPADGMLVDAITERGTPVQLVCANGMWWLPDRSMYVYFVPKWWRVPT